MRKTCPSCGNAPQYLAWSCQECGGQRYIEVLDRNDNCMRRRPECPLVGTVSGGWECVKCGDTGVLRPGEEL